jgi:epoxyqueuosine reductase QueG
MNSAYIKEKLFSHGADIVSIGDLSELPADVRYGLPIGICVAAKYPDIIIRGIADLPTKAYNNWYIKLNERLDELVTLGAEELQKQGYTAIAMTRAQVGNGETDDNTALPHKTVATRAGIGWIGKSALLVTEQYGSMIRISSILTDAPLETAEAVSHSKCGDCMICTETCPAGAVSGKEWSPELPRDEFFDPVKCRKKARERAFQGFGGGNTICGKCIEVCPVTRRAMTTL